MTWSACFGVRGANRTWASCRWLGAQIDTYAAVLTAGEPVLISGKVSFPFRGDDAEPEEEGPKEPTILLNEAVRLSDSVKKDTKQVSIRLREDLFDRQQNCL